MHLGFAVPWPDEGSWLWEFLPPGVSGDLLLAAPSPGTHKLPPYIGEWIHLARRGYDLSRYEVVFAWELRSALAVALLRRRVPRTRRPHFVAVGPILKGPLLRALPVVRHLLADADKIVCFSRAECDDNARLLRLPRDRFLFLPTPWRADEEISQKDDGFLLALGQSNRDYPTLLRAVRGTDLPVTIVAANPTALGGVEASPNVTVRYNTGHHETNELIARATLHCIPLHNTAYSSGQTVLLRAMARGKAVVVSNTPGVRDYVRNGETAVIVPPGDAGALCAALTHLWHDEGARRRIGQNGAKEVREEFGFARFTERLVSLAHDLTQSQP